MKDNTADELVEVMRNFSLSDVETKELNLALGDVASGVKDYKLSLIGKVTGERFVNFTGLKNFINSMWGFPKNLMINDLGFNFYQFIFKDNEDMRRALNIIPYVLDNQLLVLCKWEVGIEFNHGLFQKGEMWVQIWNLLMHWIIERRSVRFFKEWLMSSYCKKEVRKEDI
ncbi:hypothetical protein ACH5RR_037122 [Cinchona calisaya]|uniref:DUF4283 domain-containing protein n=1 Tax=Cinchona calisaya TaxID=153742 RepID=A0ABD2Y6H6_9GENT